MSTQKLKLKDISNFIQDLKKPDVVVKESIPLPANVIEGYLLPFKKRYKGTTRVVDYTQILWKCHLVDQQATDYVISSINYTGSMSLISKFDISCKHYLFSWNGKHACSLIRRPQCTLADPWADLYDLLCGTKEVAELRNFKE